MKKLALLIAMALAFSLTALAQGATASGQNTSESTATTRTKTTKTMKTKKSAGAAKEHSLTGCLAKNPSGTGYVLTNGRYKKGVDVNSSEDFSAHVGHTVRLTGTWAETAAGAAGMRTFTATNLKHLSNTCTMGGKAAKGAKSGKVATTAPPKS